MMENKKSGHPTQPGNRSTASNHPKQKRRPILHRLARFFKRNWVFIAVLIPVILAAVWANTELDRVVPPEPSEERMEYIFATGDGYPVDMQAMTSAWAAEAGFEKRYDLTDAERWEVASVVTAEAEGEPFSGKVAVAQCILQSCEDDGIRPDEAVVKYNYAKTRPEPTGEALEAVQAVFDFGHVAATEPIKYFYAPARCQSDWHESQVYVLTINNHKFFKEAK